LTRAGHDAAEQLLFATLWTSTGRRG
jgi:hypothetical protein